MSGFGACHPSAAALVFVDFSLRFSRGFPPLFYHFCLCARRLMDALTTSDRFTAPNRWNKIIIVIAVRSTLVGRPVAELRPAACVHDGAAGYFEFRSGRKLYWPPFTHSHSVSVFSGGPGD
jgi:hypothetical protein